VRRSVSGTALPTSSFALLAFFGFESVARLAWFTIAALVLLLIAAAVAGLRQMGYWGSLVGRLAGLAAALQVDD